MAMNSIFTFGLLTFLAFRHQPRLDRLMLGGGCVPHRHVFLDPWCRFTGTRGGAPS
jgi:hypothetical protein